MGNRAFGAVKLLKNDTVINDYIKEINELSLTTAIRINNNTIPDNTMNNGI